MMGLKPSVSIQEVSPRDGLQNENRILEPGVRADLIGLLADAGLKRIQIGAFVNPAKVPQMAGTLEVWERVRNMEELEFSVLVLNSRGLEDAISAGLKRVETFVSASETHSLRNSGVSIDQALKSARGIIERAVSKGIKVTAGVMCAMGCVYEGAIDPGKVGGIFSSILDAGPTHISVADTTGMGAPDNVERIILELQNLVERDLIGFHLHDTYGLGLQNLERALEMGVTRFDASLAGLGGCPFVRGATGNISTERTVDFLNSKGFLTGIDQGGLTKARLRLQDALGKEIGKGEN